jgi:hypothetical protein
MHAGFVAAVALTLLANDPVMTLIAGGALMTPLYLWLGIYEGRHCALMVNPLSFYFIWYVVGFGLSPFYAAYLVTRDGVISFSVVNVPPHDIAVGYVLCLLGSVALHVGMQLSRPQDEQHRAYLEKPRYTVAILLAMVVIGIAILVRPQSFQAVGNLARPLQVAPLTGLVIFGLLGHEYFRLRRDMFAGLFAAGTLFLFAINLRFGSKALLMFCLLPLFWMVLIRRHLRRWFPAVLMLLIVFYLLVVAPTVRRARATALSQGETPASHLVHSFSLPAQDPVGMLPDQADDFLRRQFDPTAVAFVSGEVERSGYQMGETMRYATYAFIPRILWPDKPALTRGAWFYTYVGGSPRESEATSSLGITAVGELYWNFGVGGVLAGMLVIGCGYGLLWRLAGSHPVTQPVHMLLYVLVSIYSMIDMPEAVTVFAAIASNLLLFGAVFLLFDRQRRGTRLMRRVKALAVPVIRPVGVNCSAAKAR